MNCAKMQKEHNDILCSKEDPEKHFCSFWVMET